jgi:hypothetical protein
MPALNLARPAPVRVAIDGLDLVSMNYVGPAAYLRVSRSVVETDAKSADSTLTDAFRWAVFVCRVASAGTNRCRRIILAQCLHIVLCPAWEESAIRLSNAILFRQLAHQFNGWPGLLNA